MREAQGQRRHLARVRRRTARSARSLVGLRAGTHPSPALALSLSYNALCGKGTYTTEGITKLCEGLEGSTITSLECAAAP